MAVLVVAATGLVSCGGKSEQAQAQELILGASEATFEAGTAQVLVSLGDTDGEGQVDFDAGQSQVRIAVDGRPTTGWIDGADVLDLLTLLFDAVGSDGLDLDVWLDDDGRVVQMQYDVDTGADQTLGYRLGLLDFGSDVGIEIPEPGPLAAGPQDQGGAP